MTVANEKKANILWVDFLANGKRLADRKEQKKLIDSAASSGITHLVIDAKIPYGQTTYPSKHAYHVSSLFKGEFKEWADRDFLMELLEWVKDTEMEVFANVDVFAEGISSSKEGIAYDHPEWKVTFYNEGMEGESSAAEYEDGSTVFVNPIHPEVVRHELEIIREVCSYPLDGIVIDRCRYPNVYGDFSLMSRKAFEDYIGESIDNWPEDIYTIGANGKDITFGAYFGKWTEWRAHNIKSFVSKARELVKGIHPGWLFADYVGSWYPLYYSEGVNWGSETYHPDLPWTSETYHRSGLAEQLDFIMTGCYYPEVFISEARENRRPEDWYSVEGAIGLSLESINGSIPVIGSLYLKDYKGNPEQFRKAIRICREKTEGVMLFDTVYLEEYGWWKLVQEELSDGEGRR